MVSGKICLMVDESELCVYAAMSALICRIAAVSETEMVHKNKIGIPKTTKPSLITDNAPNIMFPHKFYVDINYFCSHQLIGVGRYYVICEQNLTAYNLDGMLIQKKRHLCIQKRQQLN